MRPRPAGQDSGHPGQQRSLRNICHIAANRLGRWVVGLSILAGLAAPALAAQTYPEIFGTHELHSENLQMFPKWRGAVERYADEIRACESAPCKDDGWKKFVDGERGKDLMTQLREINTAMNNNQNNTDPVNCHVYEYWAAPLQFMRKDGDCEDYAIAKYMALRELGFPIDDMRIVVLNDLNLGVAHAILVVYVDGKALVLDNQISTVVPASIIHHYKPVYSINEHGWWLHRS